MTTEKYECQKHGELDQGGILRISYLEHRGIHPIRKENVYCVACIAELFNRFQDEGLLSKVKVNGHYSI
jgi:hypothetical protein